MISNDNLTRSKDALFSFLNISTGDFGAIIPAHIQSPAFFVVGGCFCLLGVVGNSLFIAAYLFQIEMRTVSNYLIYLLSVADIFACLGYNAVYMVMVAFKWTMLTCWIWLVSLPLFPILSMYAQLLISLDRVTLVTQPVGVHRRWFSKKLCTCYTIAGWLGHICLIVFLITLGKMPPSEGHNLCSSYEDLIAIDYQSLYIYVGFSIVYFGVAVTCYGKLLWYVRKKRIETRSRRDAFVRTSVTLLKLCIVSMLTVVIPPILLYIGFLLNMEYISAALLEIGILCMFPGFCVNPFFYGQRIQLFREYLLNIFCRCKKNNEIAPIPVIPSNETAVSNIQVSQVQ